MSTGLAILLSAVAATAGWLYTSRVQRLVSRRQHTYDVIFRQHDDDHFADALKEVRDAVAEGTIPNPEDHIQTKQIEKIDYFLNHYEFMCAAILCGDIDEKLIKMCEESRIIRISQALGSYIKDCQQYGGQPTMFENIETMATRWSRPPPRGMRAAYEAILLRPCPTPSLEHDLIRQDQ